MPSIRKQSIRKKKQSSATPGVPNQSAWPREFVQGLEARTLFSTAASMVISPNIALESASSSATYSTTTGYTPTEIRNAYGFSSVNFTSGSTTVAGLGQGQTIAIVDAYNDPNIAGDLSVFDAKYGLSNPPSLKVVNQSGGSSLPSTDAGWAGEISLDVEWAHAIAPDANILLVEANSATLNNLLAGVNYARNAAGVSVVSMSWGGSEFYGETAYDSYFTTPAGHQGVTFVAAAGDSGAFYGPEWPAVSPNVLSVGGTSLTLQNSTGTYGSESAWADSSGGTSQLEPMPAYQSGISAADTESYSFSPFAGFSISSNRSAPDVSYDADPNTGFAVYDSVPYEGSSGWEVVGGTSAGAPQWAALIAIADQGRALKGLGSLNGASQTLTTLYSLYSAPGTSGYSTYSSTFHDVTTGGTYFESPTAGYDQLTGLGSPRAVQVVSALTSGTATSSTTTPTPTTTTTVKTSARRQDVTKEMLPTPGLAAAATAATNSFVATSPLQTWTAVEDHFALADTAPSTLIPASFSVLGHFTGDLGADPVGLERFSVSDSPAAGLDVNNAAVGDGLAQNSWTVSPLQNALQTGLGLVEAAAATNLQSITHLLAGDAASSAASLFSTAPIAGIAPLLGSAPAEALGLSSAIFQPHTDSDGSAWEFVAGASLGVAVAGCWYLNASGREEQKLTSSLDVRRVRDGWELAPLEQR